MRTRQWIFCLGVVVEAPLLPTNGIVAKPAIRTQSTFVMPVAVTSGAIQRRILELRRSMTPFTRHGGVLSNQRETRQVVIKGSRSPPRCFGMALLAFGAELSFMPVVLAVAGDAGGHELVAIEVACMAIVAFDRRMRALQRVLRVLVVIET